MSQQAVWAVEVLAARYAEVVTSLRPEEWTSPSRCAGWSVQDLVAHTGSNFHIVAEPNVAPMNPPPIAEDLQDLLVKQRRGWTAEQVAEEFEEYREPAVAALRVVQDEPLASSPLTMSDLGTPLRAIEDDRVHAIFGDLGSPATWLTYQSVDARSTVDIARQDACRGSRI